MKTWKILRDCRLKGDGVHHAMLGVARSPSAFYRLRARGDAPRMIKLPNGELRCRRADLDAWWAACERETPEWR